METVKRNRSVGVVGQNSIIDPVVSRDGRGKTTGRNNGSSGGRAVNQNGRGYDPTRLFGWSFDIKTLHLALHRSASYAAPNQGSVGGFASDLASSSFYVRIALHLTVRLAVHLAMHLAVHW